MIKKREKSKKPHFIRKSQKLEFAKNSKAQIRWEKIQKNRLCGVCVSICDHGVGGTEIELKLSSDEKNWKCQIWLKKSQKLYFENNPKAQMRWKKFKKIKFYDKNWKTNLKW